jgi:hypothetical protein
VLAEQPENDMAKNPSAGDAGDVADQAATDTATAVAGGAGEGATLDDAVRAMAATSQAGPTTTDLAAEVAYEVLHRVDHNGAAYETGQTITLGAEHAQALLAVGVIKQAA